VQLKPHQETGAAWLASKRLALLADEMRVGKTLTAIEAAKRTGAKSILVVCPAVARFNWARSMSGWLRRPAYALTTAAEAELAPDLAAISYDLLEHLPDRKYDVLILDESHFLRHLTAKRTGRVLGKDGRVHRAKRVWALSGTPAVNYYSELWGLLYVFGIYRGSFDAFVEEFCYQRFTPFGWKISGNKNGAKLKTLLSDVMLRRKFADVAPELPPITVEEYLVECPQGLAIESHPEVTEALASRDPIAALEAIAPALSSLRRLIGVAKVDATAELVLDTLDGNDDKLVVFAYHRDAINLLVKQVAGMGAAVVDGRMSARRKDEQVTFFQRDPGCRIFIGQLIAAGTNIDLSVAVGAYVMESSWTPGENAQALMRLQNLNNAGEPKWARFIGMIDSVDEHVTRTVARKTRDLDRVFG